MRENHALREIINNINDKIAKTYPEKAPFDKHCPNGATIQQFCMLFNELCVTHGLTNAATNDVLKLLRDTTSSLKVPVNDKSINPHSGPVTGNKIDSYLPKDNDG